MLDFRLPSEYEELRKTVEEFAHEEVAPVIGDLYEREEFPYEIVARMGQMGLFGLPFPDLLPLGKLARQRDSGLYGPHRSNAESRSASSLRYRRTE
jgi:hypothetical protein